MTSTDKIINHIKEHELHLGRVDVSSTDIIGTGGIKKIINKVRNVGLLVLTTGLPPAKLHEELTNSQLIPLKNVEELVRHQHTLWDNVITRIEKEKIPLREFIDEEPSKVWEKRGLQLAHEDVRAAAWFIMKNHTATPEGVWAQLEIKLPREHILRIMRHHQKFKGV